MKDTKSQHSEPRSWLERIGQKLSGEPRDRQELIFLLRELEQRNVLDGDSLAMIEGVLNVSEMHVRDIMVPRSQMVIVEQDTPVEQYLPIVVESGHSRFPVIGENRDEVVGILLAKELLAYFANKSKDNGEFSIRDVIRAPVFIPESKRLNVLLKEFRSSRNHIAIVVDEYGGVAGLVTIEDVLEQIVGEIEDEYDIDEDTFIMEYNNNQYSVKALTPIEDFNSHFETHFREDDFDTIGGLVAHRFGHLPSRGEKIEIDGFTFTVLRADKRRIHLLQVSRDKRKAKIESENHSRD